MSDRVKWVLWQRPKGEAKYTIRRGRYRNKEATQDAIKTLDNAFEYLALPEGKEPQSNKVL